MREVSEYYGFFCPNNKTVIGKTTSVHKIYVSIHGIL